MAESYPGPGADPYGLAGNKYAVCCLRYGRVRPLFHVTLPVADAGRPLQAMEGQKSRAIIPLASTTNSIDPRTSCTTSALQGGRPCWLYEQGLHTQQHRNVRQENSRRPAHSGRELQEELDQRGNRPAIRNRCTRKLLCSRNRRLMALANRDCVQRVDGLLALRKPIRQTGEITQPSACICRATARVR
jgi:hypothetical protein